METLVADIETNGLLPELKVVWCLVIINEETGEETRYRDPDGTVALGVARLCKAETVIFHNGAGYDLHALDKLYPGTASVLLPKLRDTMVLSRLYDPERPEGHALHTFEKITGVGKSEWDDWSCWSQGQEDYCAQDVRATMAVYRWIWPKVKDWGHSLWIETECCFLVSMQMDNGFTLNERLAMEVAAECKDEMTQLEAELQKVFPPIYVMDKVFIPKKDSKSMGYVEGAPLTKIVIQEFNPGSGQQIANRLIRKYKWKPKKFTDGGQPATDESVLAELKYPEAKPLLRYMRVSKMWRQIAGPKKKDGTGGGWITHINPNTGKVHGYVNSNGAVTGRMTHSRPNTANIDKKDLRMRAMWVPKQGWKLVGCDAEGLELRMLAHYLARYDGGAYAVAVVDGKKEDKTDAHSRTQIIVGLYKRDSAKTFIYAMIYGGGDPKLAIIIFDDAMEAGKPKPKGSPKRIGAEARAKVESGIVGFGKLKKLIEQKLARKEPFKGLDGRIVRIRSAHSALNALLQGAGAIVMKLALILFHRGMCEKGFVHGVDYGFCAQVHDEAQIECRPEIADVVGTLYADSIKKAGEFLGVRCPLAGSYDVGESWADTH